MGDERCPTPSRLRRVAGIAAALVVGSLGWPAVLAFFLFLPVGWLPVEPNDLGILTLGFWAALCILCLGWTAAVGVSIRRRILRLPTATPCRRRGLRGGLSLLACCLGLAAGVWGSMVLLDVFTWTSGDDGNGSSWRWVFQGGALGASLVAPTVGLLLASASCRRWLDGAPPRPAEARPAGDGSSPERLAPTGNSGGSLLPATVS